MEIGARIQTCLLPARVEIPGLEVSARMRPATEVGGDYYDAFEVPGGGFIGIGDVAGHGLSSGLIMLMLQSAVASLCRREPMARPSDVVSAVNTVLFDNIRKRLGNDEHVTFTLIRYQEDGKLTFAGAHEELILLRQGSEKCELVETPGTWLGVTKDISKFTADSELALSEGDLLVLYTDGVTEARDARGKQLGLEQLLSTVEAARDLSTQEILNKIFDSVDAHMAEQEDDVTLVVLRYHTAPSGSRPVR
jgi:sigma-B regulation protein RsbU (phosphoserine phosphatase)